jgi:hypothetical protein
MDCIYGHVVVVQMERLSEIAVHQEKRGVKIKDKLGQIGHSVCV